MSPEHAISLRSQYRHQNEVAGSILAAELVVESILDLVGTTRSVVDLGGGTGAWCRAFKSRGVPRVLCLDHPTAMTSELLVAEDEFLAADLTVDCPDPVPSDLAISVEFAEHVSVRRADWVVEFLTRSAGLVVFSAAVPRQGGVGHVNEQWPAYWAELFARRGFTQLDIIRPRILHESRVPFWYRQNIFLYAVEPGRFAGLPQLLPPDFVVVHSSTLDRLQRPGLKATLRRIFPAALAAVDFRLHRR